MAQITKETASKWRFETKQLHVGQEDYDHATDSRAVPIYQTSSFVFRNSQHAADRFALRDAGNIYGRLTNPTEDIFEQRIASLEGGIAALSVASGAAAVTYAIQNVALAGDHIVAARNIYGGTYNLLAHTLIDYGIRTTFVDPRVLRNFEDAIQPNTKAVFIETLGNPNSDIPDIDAVAAIAHENRIPVVIDNTFGTPYLIRPIEHGADIVVHSATKFLGGHGTTLGGIIVDSGKFDWKAALSCCSRDMSAMILHALLPDFPDMRALVEKAYLNKFETEDLTPLVKVGDRYVLELFRGPTSAFKDVALSVLPQLVTAGRALRGAKDDVVILTATSGDTGKAALEGFHDVAGTRIVVFYPYKGVSRVQELQMSTQKGGNVKVCAVRGNFDDAQTGVKNVFSACRDRDLGGKSLSSANSINIGRLAPQVMYYFKAYADLVSEGRIKTGDTVHYVVPTGNFGDILAGWFAKLYGYPCFKQS